MWWPEPALVHLSLSYLLPHINHKGVPCNHFEECCLKLFWFLFYFFLFLFLETKQIMVASCSTLGSINVQRKQMRISDSRDYFLPSSPTVVFVLKQFRADFNYMLIRLDYGLIKPQATMINLTVSKEFYTFIQTLLLIQVIDFTVTRNGFYIFFSIG